MKDQLKIKHTHISYWSIIFICISICSMFLNCAQNDKIPKNQILTRIGNEIITVRDFKLNYEFGFSNLKKGKTRKRNYLNYMINENVLALEGYRLGFDQSLRVKREEKSLVEELMVEALFEKEVKSKIKVTQNEIQDSINKSKVSFKLRFWIEPYLTDANLTVAAMRARGYADVVGQKLENNPEVNFSLKNFETDYITFLEIRPELLEKIKNLPIGEISDPIELDGFFGICQILDIRRSGLLENEYKTKAPEFNKILFHRKYQQAAIKFVNDFMSAKNIVMKGEAYGLLGKAFTEWKKNKDKTIESFQDAVEKADDSAPAMKALKENRNNIFMTSSEENWTINGFLKRFNPDRISSIDKNPNGLAGALKDAAGLTIRDYFLVKEARKKHLEKSPKLQKELKQWRNKWVYEETRTFFTKGLSVSDQEAIEYFEKNKSRYVINKDHQPTFSEYTQMVKRDAYNEKAQHLLEAKIKDLEKRYPVYINEAVLDTLKVIDFNKSRWATIQLFKLGSGRPAVPVVDLSWGF